CGVTAPASSYGFSMYQVSVSSGGSCLVGPLAIARYVARSNVPFDEIVALRLPWRFHFCSFRPFWPPLARFFASSTLYESALLLRGKTRCFWPLWMRFARQSGVDPFAWR
ncbi:MAG: hypothetical protein KDI03_13610, partial [Anaerolineae bacterium]|nr:hypothetical protein [Anaerolineae bacterium]